MGLEFAWLDFHTSHSVYSKEKSKRSFKLSNIDLKHQFKLVSTAWLEHVFHDYNLGWFNLTWLGFNFPINDWLKTWNRIPQSLYSDMIWHFNHIFCISYIGLLILHELMKDRKGNHAQWWWGLYTGQFPITGFGVCHFSCSIQQGRHSFSIQDLIRVSSGPSPAF